MKCKKIMVLLLSIAIILGISMTVKAETIDSYSVNLNTNKTTLKAGETVTISLKVDNINIQSGEKGIGAYEGNIEYDSNVFEDLKMSGNDEWDKPLENNGKFTSVKSDGICTSESQEIATITLKVKANAKSGNTVVNIKNFEASNGEKNISTEDKEIKFTIENDQSTVNQNNNVNNNQNNNNYNASIKNGKLPYAGNSVKLIIGISIVAIIGVVVYIKYKRLY